MKRLRPWLVGLVSISFLLCACSSTSMYAKSAEAFGVAMATTVTGVERALAEYEREELLIAAERLEARAIKKEADMVKLTYPAEKSFNTMRLLLEALERYAEGLASLAKLGSARAAGRSVKKLGQRLEKADVNEADDWGNGLGRLALLLLDREIARSVEDVVKTADPDVQNLAESLELQLGKIAPTVDALYSRRWNTLRRELWSTSDANLEERKRLLCKAGGQMPYCKTIPFDRSQRKRELLLEMRKLASKKDTVKVAINKTREAIKSMAKAHQTLADYVQRDTREIVLDSVRSFVESASAIPDTADVF